MTTSDQQAMSAATSKVDFFDFISKTLLIALVQGIFITFFIFFDIGKNGSNYCDTLFITSSACSKEFNFEAYVYSNFHVLPNSSKILESYILIVSLCLFSLVTLLKLFPDRALRQRFLLLLLPIAWLCILFNLAEIFLSGSGTGGGALILWMFPPFWAYLFGQFPIFYLPYIVAFALALVPVRDSLKLVALGALWLVSIGVYFGG